MGGSIRLEVDATLSGMMMAMEIEMGRLRAVRLFAGQSKCLGNLHKGLDEDEYIMFCVIFRPSYLVSSLVSSSHPGRFRGNVIEASQRHVGRILYGLSVSILLQMS